MKRRLTWAVLPALLLAVLSSCEPGRSPHSEPPTAPSFSEHEEDWERVEGRIPDQAADLIEVSQLIGLEGGSLHLAGHSITVPAGAVSGLTLFTMALVTEGYVEVELSAVNATTGLEYDGEDASFQDPVTLSLTYAWASNVSDPAKLFIVRTNDGGSVEKLTPVAVDTQKKTVTVKLDHFSKYCLASN